MSAILRLSSLFVLGALVSLILDHLQTDHRITIHTFHSLSWVPFICICGLAAVGVGTLLPALDELLHVGPGSSTYTPPQRRGGLGHLVRLFGGFIGVNYAASKLPWHATAYGRIQVSLTLLILSLGLWYLFDRTRQGLLLGLMVSLAGTLMGLSWFPSILYSSTIFFGSVGRELKRYKIHRE